MTMHRDKERHYCYQFSHFKFPLLVVGKVIIIKCYNMHKHSMGLYVSHLEKIKEKARRIGDKWFIIGVILAFIAGYIWGKV